MDFPLHTIKRGSSADIMNAGLIETFNPDQQARLHGCGYLLYIRVVTPSPFYACCLVLRPCNVSSGGAQEENAGA